ncbi:RNA polymerase sigma factor [Prevotella sp.]|uniref:RNA polymerase sigma factor n=1 Tax=Prevotella sp. TaxID=59823 RepID=UPI002F94A906
MKIISFQNDILPLKNQLYRLALRITMNSAEAEDIVQETMIKVWNKRDSWTEIESIEAFCFTICRNLSLDSIKRHENQNDTLGENGNEHPDSAFNPYEQTSRNNRVETIRHIIDHLPEKQKSCMQLRDFEGKPYKEIARILEISEEQVKVNIFRARQAVKLKFQELDNYGL